MSEQYTYEVARIRAMEPALFSNAVIEQLIGTENYESALRFLEEKGWGKAGTAANGDAMLKAEEEKMWKTMGDLHLDKDVFALLTMPQLFHNVKCAIKEAVAGTDVRLPQGALIYYEETEPNQAEIRSLIEKKEFDSLPVSMQEPAREAYTRMLRTGDAQIVDIIMDRACLDTMYAIGQASKASVIREYTESYVAIKDIGIAVRAAKVGKNRTFLENSLAPCRTVDKADLIRAASSGLAALKDYLLTTSYKDAASYVEASPSAFECWRDNALLDRLREEKMNPFTIGPVVAYLIARQNEIKTVRIVLSGKRNGLSAAYIRERVRNMYV